MSWHTVKSEASSIYRKLGASSRTQAVARSRELGLLEGLGPVFTPSEDMEAPSMGWTQVRKKRRISRFSLERADRGACRGAGPGSRGARWNSPRSARGQDWWSLGFEETGPGDLLRSGLEATAALVFAQPLSNGLEPGPGQCRSCTQWLGQRE